MLRRYSVRNLDGEAIAILAEIKAIQRREIGAILEDCILEYWYDLMEEDSMSVSED